jgi:hypothetical protein
MSNTAEIVLEVMPACNFVACRDGRNDKQEKEEEETTTSTTRRCDGSKRKEKIRLQLPKISSEVGFNGGVIRI